MNLFEKYLSIWVGISILMGIILGNSLPSLFTTIASFELHNVNFVIAVLIWAMIFILNTLPKIRVATNM